MLLAKKEFLKTKTKSYGDEVTVFHDIEIPKVSSNHTCLSVISLNSALNPIQDGHFWGCSRMGWRGKKAPLPKICHTYPTIMKLGTVIPYSEKIQKTYESRDTPFEFC